MLHGVYKRALAEGYAFLIKLNLTNTHIGSIKVIYNFACESIFPIETDRPYEI
jgi:hypothetical protein